MTATPATTLWQALRGGPRRFLRSLWPLRALAYVVSGAVTGAVTLAWLPVALVAGAVVGVPVLTLPLAALERRRHALLGGPPLPDPHRPPDRPGPVAWLRARYAEPATWRELAYLVLHGTVLLVLDTAAIALGGAPILLLGFGSFTRSGAGGPAGAADLAMVVALAGLGVLAVLLLAAVVLYAVPLAAAGHGQLARLLLGPGPEAVVHTLTRSRARLIDAFEVERRRIERDLHDGAQQQLLALGMTLVAAELALDAEPGAPAEPGTPNTPAEASTRGTPGGPGDRGEVRALVRRAAEQSRTALAGLRELIRGIHPRVLTDLGLPAAVAELADRSATPVTVALDLPGRLPPAVESTAYFVVAEALANAAKHAAASRIEVTGGLRGPRLAIEVRDDGTGGANPAKGTGLAGLGDRVDAVGGTLTLSSPTGGPTALTLVLPAG